MSGLTLTHVSETTLGRLDELARREGRSREDIASDILERELGFPRHDRKALAAIAAEIRRMTPPGPQSDSADLIRAIRDE